MKAGRTPTFARNRSGEFQQPRQRRMHAANPQTQHLLDAEKESRKYSMHCSWQPLVLPQRYRAADMVISLRGSFQRRKWWEMHPNQKRLQNTRGRGIVQTFIGRNQRHHQLEPNNGTSGRVTLRLVLSAMRLHPRLEGPGVVETWGTSQKRPFGKCKTKGPGRICHP